jgi:hypothetical protein
MEHGGGLLNQRQDFPAHRRRLHRQLATQRKSHAHRHAAAGHGRPTTHAGSAGSTWPKAAWPTRCWKPATPPPAWPCGSQHPAPPRGGGRRSVNERAQRNLANGYGPLAEALDALQRHAEARVWYQRENKLLAELRVRHPQVKALVARLDESDRDLALQDVLTGRVAEGVARFQALDARLGPTAAPKDADDAKYALVRARVLLAAPRLPAAQRQALVNQAQAAVQILRSDAAAEPFNALLAREAALGAQLLARAVGPADAAGACKLAQEASAALETLVQAQRLPATVLGRRQDAQAAAKCGPGPAQGG